MVVPSFKIANRSDRRLFEKEAFRVMTPLAKIEEEFFALLFDEKSGYSYQAIFHVFKERYEQESKKLARNKYKMLSFDLDYFSNRYKPLEYAN